MFLADVESEVVIDEIDLSRIVELIKDPKSLVELVLQARNQRLMKELKFDGASSYEYSNQVGPIIHDVCALLNEEAELVELFEKGSDFFTYFDDKSRKRGQITP